MAARARAPYWRNAPSWQKYEKCLSEVCEVWCLFEVVKSCIRARYIYDVLSNVMRLARERHRDRRGVATLRLHCGPSDLPRTCQVVWGSRRPPCRILLPDVPLLLSYVLLLRRRRCVWPTAVLRRATQGPGRRGSRVVSRGGVASSEQAGATGTKIRMRHRHVNQLDAEDGGLPPSATIYIFVKG